jgi:hypothetical protein
MHHCVFCRTPKTSEYFYITIKNVKFLYGRWWLNRIYRLIVSKFLIL